MNCFLLYFFSEQKMSFGNLLKKYGERALEEQTSRGVVLGFLSDLQANNVCSEQVDIRKLEKVSSDWLNAPSV